ncbi:MAG: hypothetical protein ACKOCB_11925 [Planctomycetia bacterium]
MPRLAPWLLALGLVLLPSATPLRAEDPPAAPGNKPAGPDAPPDDGADGPMPFGEEVNKAIEEGVAWLKAKPRIYTFRDEPAAHWGLVKGERIYGGGDGPQYRHPAGPTALALYTLLKCGVDPKDPVITEGFHWLKVVHPITEETDGQEAPQFSWHHTQAAGAYEMSVMVLALTAKYDAYKRTKNSADAAKAGKLKITNKDDLEWLQAMVQGLVERRGTPSGEGSEPDKGWRYNVPVLTLSSGNSNWTRNSGRGHGGNQDLSSTQLAALALYSAHRFGVKVEPEIWWDILAFALAQQEDDGPEHARHDPAYVAGGYAPPKDKARGFCYMKGSADGSEGKATGSMTACGLGTILICKEVICETDKGRKRFLDKKMDTVVDKATWDALAWLDKNWSAFENKYSTYGYPIYYLYSLERAMDILGKNLVGKNLWYQLGARQLLDKDKPVEVDERQKKGTRKVPGTHWMTNSTHEPKDVLDTCFALLFLKRATKGLIPRAVTGGDEGPRDNR